MLKSGFPQIWGPTWENRDLRQLLWDRHGIDAVSGRITVRTYKNGTPKETSKHLDVPADTSNGLLFTIVKNIDPTVETVVSMVAASERPRIVKLHISPAEGSHQARRDHLHHATLFGENKN